MLKLTNLRCSLFNGVEIFKNTYFPEPLRTTASVIYSDLIFMLIFFFFPVYVYMIKWTGLPAKITVSKLAGWNTRKSAYSKWCVYYEIDLSYAFDKLLSHPSRFYFTLSRRNKNIPLVGSPHLLCKYLPNDG